jgi:hypothetical protein
MPRAFSRVDGPWYCSCLILFFVNKETHGFTTIHPVAPGAEAQINPGADFCERPMMRCSGHAGQVRHRKCAHVVDERAAATTARVFVRVSSPVQFSKSCQIFSRTCWVSKIYFLSSLSCLRAVSLARAGFAHRYEKNNTKDGQSVPKCVGLFHHVRAISRDAMIRSG